MREVRRCTAFISAASLLAGLAGCSSSLGERDPVDTGTFGTTVLTLVCKRISYLDSLAAYTAGTSKTVDVSGDTYRDMCRLSLAAPPDAPDDLKALEATRDHLTTATDATFPDGFLPDLQTFLTSNQFLAAYDDDTATNALNGLVATLRLFANDTNATAALERVGTRLAYRPIEPGLGAVRAAVDYPGMNDFILSLTTAVTTGGAAKGEWDHLIAAAGGAMRDAQVAANPTDTQRTSQLAVNLLLTQSDLLGSASTSIPLVRRDRRGVAQVATIGSALAAPFVDKDGDGLADVNAVGQFVDASGQVLAVPTPFTGAPDATVPTWANFDSTGRPTDANGNLIYTYVDVDKTVLAALARDGINLFDPSKGTALDLLRGASALMGPRIDATKTYDGSEPPLTYRGYDLTQSALLDMLYGYLQILRDPNVFDTLTLGDTLLRNYQPQAAQLAEAVIEAARKGDAHPEASIPANKPFWDDSIPVIQKILANPALTRSLMKAMEDPRTANLGTHFMKFMQYKDQFSYDQNTQAVVGAFATLVDRTQVDQGFNRSLFQRILLLIAASDGAVAENKAGTSIPTPIPGINLDYNQGALFQVNNLAVFFVQSIAYTRSGTGYLCEDAAGQAFDGNTKVATTPAGCTAFGSGWRAQPKANFNYDWSNGGLGGATAGSINLLGGDGYLESQTGITGMRTHPTPQALGRVLFLNPWPNSNYLANISDPLKDKWGSLFTAKHAGTLPVWEEENFYSDIQPIVQAFADNNQEQLFVDLMDAINKDWASAQSVDTQTATPSGAYYVSGSQGVTYEPLIIDQLTDGSLMAALNQTAPVLDAITINSGSGAKDYITVVDNAARFVLTPLAGLANRQGMTTSTTADGQPVTTLSPWQILADAYVEKQARIAASGAEGTAWTGSIENLVDVLARGDNVPTVGWQWRNPRLRGVADALVQFLITRLKTHQTAGDLTAWLTTNLPGSISDTLANPLFAGMADFIVSLEATPDTRMQIESFLVYLNNEVDYGQAFDTNVTAIGDLLQLGLDDQDLAPIVHVVGQAVDPSNGWLDAHLEFVKAARASDVNGALVSIAVNLYTEYRPGHTSIGDLIDGISEVLRANPYTDLGAHYTAADYAAMLNGVANFLDDNKRGLRKFIRIIQTRND